MSGNMDKVLMLVRDKLLYYMEKHIQVFERKQCMKHR